jgi:hypothetical protein
VKYSIRKVVKGTSSVYDQDVWEILKTPQQGDSYLIATYPNVTLARWCLGTFHTSLEVQLQGGSVEVQTSEELQEPRKIAPDTPDELIC